MELKRLNDDEIQAYLDQLKANQKVSLPDKVKLDKETRLKLRDYSHLYESLQEEVKFTVPANFADNVLAKIEDSSWFLASVWQFFFVSLVFLAGLSTAFFFGGFQFLANAGQKVPAAFSFLEKAKALLADLSLDFGIVGSGLLVLGLLSFLDHILKLSQSRPLSH